MSDLQNAYYQAQINELQRQKRSRRWRRLMWATVLVVGAAALFGLLQPASLSPSSSAKAIPVVRIGGEIGPKTSLHALTLSLEKAFAMPAPAVILSVDSPGGDPTMAQRIKARLKFLRAQHPEKKVIAVCERLCASAAYMIAIQADEILAGPYSLVGSIGAIITYTNFADLMQRIGIKHTAYASGPYKAMLSPFMPASEHDERKARDIVTKMGNIFTEEVKQRRSATRDKNIDTGEIWTAQQAMELGLIDRIGVIEDVAFGDFNGSIPVVIEVRESAWNSIVGSAAQIFVDTLTKDSLEVR